MLVVVVEHQSPSRGPIEIGNIKHLVVVSVQPGYAGNPGHDGWGKIIATIC